VSPTAAERREAEPKQDEIEAGEREATGGGRLAGRSWACSSAADKLSALEVQSETLTSPLELSWLLL
jgi:hypothetical protein